MDMRLFFDGLSDKNIDTYKSLKGFGAHVDFFGSVLPELEKADIAFFTIKQSLEKEEAEQTHNDAYHQLRSGMYTLKSFTKTVKIVDLGNLRAGATLDDTIGRISEVSAHLIRKDILPVVLGCDHELDMGQFLSYEEMGKMLSVLTVDAAVDMDSSNDEEFGHTQKMLLHHPNYLFDYCHLGYQRYHVEKKVLDTFMKLNFEVRSVGQMRDNVEDIEPLMRAADMLSFDISAIRNAELPINNVLYPFGLSGEEACQLCWYAGTNEKLTSVGLYGLTLENEKNELVSKVVSTMIWYFIEGFVHRKVEYSFQSNFHIKYIVPLLGSNKNLHAHELVFYKSKQTDKWWMEIPVAPDEMKNFGRNVIIPCSHSDYQTANQGIVPDRWLKAMEKYI